MAVYITTPSPALPPPSTSVGVLGWMRKNLFSSFANSILTLIGVYLLFLIIPPTINWALFQADWVGTSREACSGEGACWVFVTVRFQQFMFGFYPPSEYWRVVVAFSLVGFLIAWLLIEETPKKGLVGIFTIFCYPVIAYLLFYGGALGLPVVETHKWGGLMLTLILATIGMFCALPIGIILALGRRSTMPIAKSLSVVFIEFWRGVPLITVLFMSSVMLPIFMPEELQIDKLLRALIGIVFFQSAYMAEVVRGGLQAIPKGQYEAAEALGLSYWKCTFFIILPQALKLVIPGIVNTFIALFKDTTLVLIIGLFDLLAVVQSAFADAKWIGYSVEGYVFVAGIYWISCFSMSRYSQYLERKLHTGHAR
ncbi:MAG: amino acid ABC transporter permease [Proteobacteria bacterium]|nr:amino acid ABC transporter permease [Pseudomonadota bacterium]MBU1454579.1 amino acid ABC transporter permease [Pseudomonadota bacterium]